MKRRGLLLFPHNHILVFFRGHVKAFLHEVVPPVRSLVSWPLTFCHMQHLPSNSISVVLISPTRSYIFKGWGNGLSNIIYMYTQRERLRQGQRKRETDRERDFSNGYLFFQFTYQNLNHLKAKICVSPPSSLPNLP